MEIQGHTLPARWVHSIVALLRVHDYGEAFALAEFFPVTPERVLLQYFALLGQQKFTEANSLLEQSNLSPQSLPINFTTLILELDLDLLRIVDQAIDGLRFSTANFCAELCLLRPLQSLQTVIDKMLAIAAKALTHDKLEIANACFDRMVALDDSHTRLLQYAEVALANRRTESADVLVTVAQNFINRALAEVPVDDYESKLKAAKLLAIDALTFDHARELYSQVLRADPSLTSRVFDTLLPLVEYKLYFRGIVDFLLELAPQRAPQIAIRLVNGHKIQRDQALLEKALNVLDEVGDLEWEGDFQLADALIAVGRHSEKFETYAQRLLNLAAAPRVFLEAVEVLLDRKSRDYALVARLLEHLLLLHPNSRAEVLSGYWRLSNLAAGEGQTDVSDGFRERALALSTGLQEFLERGVRTDLYQRLLFLNNSETHFNLARWYRSGETDEVAVTLIISADSYQRKEALYALLADHAQFDTNRLIVWIKAFFQSDLGLTKREARQIQETLTALAPDLQREITDGLATQKVRDRTADIRFSRSLAGSMDLHWSAYHSLRLDPDEPERLMEILGESGQHNLLPLARFSRHRLLSLEPPKVARKAKLRIERHTRVEFPNQCALEKKVELRIQLTKTPPAKTRVRKKIKIDLAPRLKKIELAINVTASSFAMPERRKLMSMSLNKDSETVTFTLIPLEFGGQVIEVEIFYQSFRVGYLLIKTFVTELPPGGSPPNVLVMETPANVLKKAEKLQAALDRRVLHATWFEKESRLSYTVYSHGVNESPEWETRGPDLQGGVETYLQQLNEFLSQVVVQGNPSDAEWDSTLLNLQSIGASLFAALIPASLAAHARDWKDGSLVIVSTNEQWIPWELFHDGQDFWGKRFIIARLPRLSDRRSIPDDSRPEGRVKARQLKRVVNVVGGDVGESEGRKASNLFSMLDSGIHVELLQEQPISSLDKALGKTDLLHFTCHGRLEPHMLQVSKDDSILTNLLPQTVQNLPLEPGSLVFANTCTAAVPVLTFGRFSSFAWEFYRRGAGAFVGTLGEVPTTHALSFAESIYRELFSKRRKTTVGQAVALAKTVVARERNLFWLLYCIYGDPDYVLRVSKQRRA